MGLFPTIHPAPKDKTFHYRRFFENNNRIKVTFIFKYKKNFIKKTN